MAVNINHVNNTVTASNGNVSVNGIAIVNVKSPSNVSPANAATNVQPATLTLQCSAYYSLFGVPMSASQWQISTSNTFSTFVLDTGDISGTSTSYTVSSSLLQGATIYYWRARYKDADGSYSDWSTSTSFLTAADSNVYIPTPTATPANFGDALEGGFYTGIIWNEVTQSADSLAISTGSKTITVTNIAPLFYFGQTLEIRSRANPANKMVGTVTGSKDYNLTVSITSVGGSGTFTDWSVMSRYRIIVAPKASGENAGIFWKNASTAAPTATITLSEGYKATMAMVAADTSTVYPAAHWCKNLSINSYTDWYLPSRDELELCWRNLKPGTNNNYVSAKSPSAYNYTTLGSIGTDTGAQGENYNSSPLGSAYTTTVPAQTAAAAFKVNQTEAFTFTSGGVNYWTSSEYGSTVSWYQTYWTNAAGAQQYYSKNTSNMVRAVRRSII